MKSNNMNNLLEFYLLALDNLDQGIAICDENFKPLIHNVSMIYNCHTFKGKLNIKRRIGELVLPKEILTKLSEFKNTLPSSISNGRIFSSSEEHILPLRCLFFTYLQ